MVDNKETYQVDPEWGEGRDGGRDMGVKGKEEGWSFLSLYVFQQLVYYFLFVSVNII
ncbi:MAG: hypothetical protein ACREHG_09910 [Candidatus Saccharimonadales bacterium]